MKYHFKTKDQLEAYRIINSTEAFTKLWTIIQSLRNGVLSNMDEQHKEYLLEIIDIEFVNNNLE